MHRFLRDPAPILDPTVIAKSPRWFPLRIAADAAIDMLELDEASYRSASFLDERLLAMGGKPIVCPIETLQQATTVLRPQCHYIFHIGHVGSTLVSRLIGEHEDFFCLREPGLLKALVGPDSVRPGTVPLGRPLPRLVLSLLSRTWREGQRVVIKATSVVNEIAEFILADIERPLAVFMFASANNYLRGILAGPNSRMESQALAPSRMRRLGQMLDSTEFFIPPRSEGELVAMNWLCEMVTLHLASQRFTTRVHWVDFDEFLANPEFMLCAIFNALGSNVSAATTADILASPLMSRYSKAPEYAYDAALRREVLASAEWEHATELRRGMLWLHSMAARHSVVSVIFEESRKRGGGF